MDSSITVSVCMITYNHEAYIAEAIDGVLKQKCDFPLELIISDDHSSDNTRIIIESYMKGHPKLIKARFNELNLGMMPNFIKTLKECKGKYVAICEGDDYWTDPLKLKKQVELIEKHPECSMCVAQTAWVKEGKTINISGEGNKLLYNFHEVLDNIIYFHTSTYLVRKKYLDVYTSVNPELYLGDTAMRYVLSDAAPFVLLNEIVSVYRITGNGVWSGAGQKKKIHWNIKKFKAFYFYFKPEYRMVFLEKLVLKYWQLLIFNVKHFEAVEIFKTMFNLLYWRSMLTLYNIKCLKNYKGTGSD